MAVELKVLTLNCWGIPLISADRRERFAAIANEIVTGEYDIVVLQEVWKNSDYYFITEKASEVLPYSHYFHSGVIGAGICLFSKAPIVDAFFQCWMLNGYAHKIQHGDWFGGKGVGLCKIICHGLKINIYTAHLHAEYNPKNDEYLPHRICQAFEFSQFVKCTGETSDINIVAGDFNCEPEDIIYRILRYNANLLDSFLECEMPADEFGGTNEHPRNSYTPKAALKQSPNGKRIDYIMYNYNSGTNMKCLTCQTPLDKCNNELSRSLSDHEAVVATLHITKTVSAVPMELTTLERKAVLEEVDNVLEANMVKLDRHQLYYIILSVGFFCAILFDTVHIHEIPYVIQTIFAVLLSIAMAFCIFMASIWNRIERNGIISVLTIVKILLRNFQDVNLTDNQDTSKSASKRLL